MANHGLPTVSSNYTIFPTEIDDRLDDLTRWMDPALLTTTASGVVASSYRINSTAGTSLQFEKSNTAGVYSAITLPFVMNINGTVNGTTVPSSATLVKTTDKLSVHAATTSAELAGVISDETGTGALVFGTGPTIGAPLLTLSTASATTDGRISWDTTNKLIQVGDGTSSKNFVPTASVSGDATMGTTGVLTIANNAVTYGKFQQGAALSVLSNATNATANYTALTATAAGNGVLRESGSALGFGLITAANITNSTITYTKIQNVSATDKILGRVTAGAGIIEEISCTAAGRSMIAAADAAAQKTLLSLNSVENTALSTWAGSANITTLGTIATGTWNATAIADGKIASALTGKTYNGLTITTTTGSLTISNGVTLTASGTATISGGSHSGTNTGDQATIFDSGWKSIINPGGGAYSSATATVTGAIAITLPVAMTNSMIRMTIRVYEYYTNKSFDIYCGGYTYAVGNTWANNPFAYIVGNPGIDRNLTVRFGYTAGAKAVIYIGELGTVWSYPQVMVTDVQVGYGGQSATWTTGWTIGFQASAFENVTATVTDTQIGRSDTANTANTLVKRDASGNFTAGTITANLTGTATACSGNAATVTNGVYTNGSYADPAWITSLAKSKVGLGSVENTALSTWAGSANITTLGTITTGTVPWARLSGVPNYAGAATAGGAATSLAGFTVSNTTTITDTVASNAIGYVTSVSILSQTDGALYTQYYSNLWQHEIFGDYRTGQIAVRGKNNGTWQAWRVQLDDTNYNSYAPKLDGTGATGTWTISTSGYARGLARSDAAMDTYNVQSRWDGTYWELAGYSGASTLHAYCKVGYATNAGSAAACSGNSATVSDGVYLSTAQTISGQKTFSQKPIIQLNTSTPVYTTGHLELQSTNGSSVSMGFHRAGYTACQLRHDADGLILSGTSQTTAANFYAYGNITAYSDSRLKKNIRKIENSLDKVSKLSGYTFEKINDSVEGTRHTGVIAQEVLEVLPEAVMEQGGHYSVAYGNMVGLLIEAIKELKAEVEELKNGNLR